MDTLPIYGLGVAFETSDAAGCNWVAFNSLAEHPISELLPRTLMDEYPEVDFDLQLVYKDPVSNMLIIFCPTCRTSRKIS